MKILLFGTSNVGKTTTAGLLAERLGYRFFDLDDEVKQRMGITMEEFVNSGNLRWRDQQRGRIIKEILQIEEDLVLAVTPITYPDSFQSLIHSDDILSIELYDTPENIFSRLIFSDENDNFYTDDKYKNEHQDYYLYDIREDQAWYGKIYDDMGIHNRLFINNDPPEKVVDRLVAEYSLKTPVSESNH